MIVNLFKKYVWMLGVPLSVPIAHSYMYQVMSAPSDATGHALGVFLISFAWSIFIAIIFTIGMALNRTSKAGRNYGFGLLYLPLGFFLLIVTFYERFRSYVQSIHPNWLDGSSLAEDGIAFVVISCLLAVFATIRIYSNSKVKISQL